jgi:hypothetical protein
MHEIARAYALTENATMAWVSTSTKRGFQKLKPILAVMRDFASPVLNDDPELRTLAGQMLFHVATVAWNEGAAESRAGIASGVSLEPRNALLAKAAESLSVTSEALTQVFDALVARRRHEFASDPRWVAIRRLVPRLDGHFEPHLHSEIISREMSLAECEAARARLFGPRQ